MTHEHPKALEIIDGIGVHYYSDLIVPASIFDFVTQYHPDKFILATEASEGTLFKYTYTKNICEIYTRNNVLYRV